VVQLHLSVDATFLRVKNVGHGFTPESGPTQAEIRATALALFDKIMTI
jgi:hypothetical protein